MKSSMKSKVLDLFLKWPFLYSEVLDMFPVSDTHILHVIVRGHSLEEFSEGKVHLILLFNLMDWSVLSLGPSYQSL